MKKRINMTTIKNRASDNTYYFKIVLAGKKIEIECIYKSIFYQCRDYLSKFDEPDIIVKSTIQDIYQEALRSKRLQRSISASDDGVGTDFIGLEPVIVYKKVANAMIAYNTLVIHGAAIAINDSCYIFTAPSGTGKTTHIQNWLKMIPNSFVVNGDKPLVNVKEKIVYGSPWCGKEGLNTNTSVPLAGIIALERGRSNKISQVRFKDMLPTYFRQIYFPDNPEIAVKAYQLIEHLKDVPCYRLTCNMEEQSAIVSYYGLCGGDPQQ